MNKRVLFISASIGLGHVTRDIAIANEIRSLRSDVEIHWLAGHPANLLLEESGERLLPEASEYLDENLIANQPPGGLDEPVSMCFNVPQTMAAQYRRFQSCHRSPDL